MNRRTVTISTLPLAQRSRRAFTLPELILGILFTAMIGASCAAVTLAVSTGWKQADSSNAEYLTRGRTSIYVQSLLRGAKTIGLCRNGSLESPSAASAATVIFWRADLNGDRLIQLKEVAMLQHSVSDNTLMLYQASFPSPAVESAANITIAESWLSISNGPELFKANAYVSGRVAGSGIVGARFDVINVASTTQRPSLEFLLKTSMGGSPATYEYGSATLRPPQ
jgi:hypothetical protein